MDNLRGLLRITRMDKIPNARINELWGVTKGVNERIDELVLREIIGNYWIAKRMHVGECVGSLSVDRPWKK